MENLKEVGVSFNQLVLHTIRLQMWQSMPSITFEFLKVINFRGTQWTYGTITWKYCALKGRKWPTSVALRRWGTSENLFTKKSTFSFSTLLSATQYLQDSFYLHFRLKWLQHFVLQVIFNGFNFSFVLNSVFLLWKY